MQQKATIWHPIAFITCQLLAVAIYGSWLYPPTRAILDSTDASLFFSLNGSLHWGESWQLFWAYANTKMADIAVGIVMIILFLLFCFGGKKYLRIERLVAFGIMCAMILLTQDGGLANYYVSVIDISRASPSLLLEPAIRLSELYPNIELKDHSASSFPGDHGIVVLIWLSCIWFYASWRWGLLAIVVTLLILLPRMVVGAHWLTDNLVGSAALVLLMDAWILCTPLAYYLHKLGTAILAKLLPRSWS